MKTAVNIAFALPLLAALLGCSVARDLTVADGQSRSGGFRTVEGDITLGSNARIGAVRTVSGDIAIGAGSRVKGLATVDGDIALSAGVEVNGSVSAVAGDIVIGPGCSIAQDVRAVAGRIQADGSAIGGDISLNAGAIHLRDTVVDGSIIINTTSDQTADAIEVDIGPGSRVAAVIVKKGAPPTRLRVHSSARVDRIEGVQAERYE